MPPEGIGLLNPTVDQERVKAAAKRAIDVINSLGPPDTEKGRLEVVYALALALASSASAAGVSHIEDVTDQVKSMFRQIEMTRPSRGPAPKVQVVSRDTFDRVARQYGVRFDK